MRTRITTTFIQSSLPIALRRTHTAPVHTMTMKKVAVVYATKGGMGDAGKFAAALAAPDEKIDPRIVSLSRDSVEGGTHGIADDEVDVKDDALRAQLRRDLAEVTIAHADVDDTTATARVLDSAFDGADAVVACVGSRQPSFGRWVSQGAELILAAMKKQEVKRLVILSSMGIGEDWIPFGVVKVIWSTMLNTVSREVRRDLNRMEELVRASDLDYLFVRPVGLTPEEPPKPKEQWVVAREKVNVNFSIAKKDVARFMVEEAVNPTYSRSAVLLGSRPKK